MDRPPGTSLGCCESGVCKAGERNELPMVMIMSTEPALGSGIWFGFFSLWTVSGWSRSLKSSHSDPDTACLSPLWSDWPKTMQVSGNWKQEELGVWSPISLVQVWDFQAEHSRKVFFFLLLLLLKHIFQCSAAIKQNEAGLDVLIWEGCPRYIINWRKSK